MPRRQQLTAPRANQSGFTIVELLIVIVIIGILAAITVVAYSGIQNRAVTAALQSDLRQAASQLEVDRVTNGVYPESEEEAANGDGLSSSSGNTLEYSSESTDTFCLTAFSERSGVSDYYISNEVRVPTEGTCDGHGGSGGVGVPSFVQEFSGWTNESSVSTPITVPSAGVPAGHGLVLSVASTRGTPLISSVDAIDSKGNTYALLHTSDLTGGTTSIAMLYSNITTALDGGDTITLTPNLASNRMAVSVYEFTEHLQPDVTSTFDNGGESSTSLTSGITAATSHNEEIVVGAFALQNAGRTFTTGEGFSGGTKVTTDAGSGDRAIATEYKLVSSTGKQEATGALNSGGFYIGSVWTFSVLDSPPERSGKPKVWDGSGWTEHPAKVWNGTAWIEHRIKGYDGDQWVTGK